VLPLPEPLVPDVMVIQDAFAAAVQVQPAGAVTDTDAVPPAAAKLCDVGATAKLQIPVEKPNVFDMALETLPPGPTAATAAV
jgi:hypothetical protein